MTEKKALLDLETFVARVNDKSKKRNGKKVCFGFVKRKRK
jgi:hypothetical protein